MKKLFRKQNVIDTALSVGLGGVANVGVDYALAQIPQLATVDEKYVNLGKFAVGVIGSTMVSNRYVKDAMNGVAVVGISNFAKTMIDGSASIEGVPQQTVGRVGRRMPLRGRNRMRGKMGVSASNFIS